MSEPGQPEVVGEGERPNAGGGGGCLKALGCGCIVVILGVILVGVGVYMKRAELLAFGVEKFAEHVAEDQMHLPPEEVAAVMRPLEELTDKIREGDMTQEEGAAILKRLADGNEGAAILLRGFETRYVQHEELVAPEDQEAAALSINRFANGLLDQRIPRARLEPLADVVLVEDSNGDLQLKEPLTQADVEQVLSIMDACIEEFGIDDPYDALDLEGLMRTAIEGALDGESEGL